MLLSSASSSSSSTMSSSASNINKLDPYSQQIGCILSDQTWGNLIAEQNWNMRSVSQQILSAVPTVSPVFSWHSPLWLKSKGFDIRILWGVFQCEHLCTFVINDIDMKINEMIKLWKAWFSSLWLFQLHRFRKFKYEYDFKQWGARTKTLDDITLMWLYNKKE